MKKILISAVVAFTSLLHADELESYQPNHQLLEQACRIPTGGGASRHYLGLEIDGHHYKGERLWNLRWDLIKDALNFEGKRVLELGCNTSLASICVKKFGKAKSCVGVDVPEERLKKMGKPRQYVAARLVQKAFDVTIPIKKLDLDHSQYEKILGDDFDIVFCLSLLRWVQDEKRLMNYLSRFNHVIFEGHRSDQEEIACFAQYGFTNYEILGSTQIGLSYPKDKYRTLIHFFKDSSE